MTLTNISKNEENDEEPHVAQSLRQAVSVTVNIIECYLPQAGNGQYLYIVNVCECVCVCCCCSVDRFH